LADCENKLLVELADSEGNILENTKLIASLNETKSQGIEIEQALAEQKEVGLNIDQQRNVYR
jgi:hypothetical protein